MGAMTEHIADYVPTEDAEASDVMDLPEPTIWDEVAEERRKAHAKHGDKSMENGNPLAMRRFHILIEEVGEVSREFNDAEHEERAVDVTKLRKELVQVAAVAASWADALGHMHPDGFPCGRCCWPEDCALYCTKATWPHNDTALVGEAGPDTDSSGDS